MRGWRRKVAQISRPAQVARGREEKQSKTGIQEYGEGLGVGGEGKKNRFPRTEPQFHRKGIEVKPNLLYEVIQ